MSAWRNLVPSQNIQNGRLRGLGRGMAGIRETGQYPRRLASRLGIPMQSSAAEVGNKRDGTRDVVKNTIYRLYKKNHPNEAQRPAREVQHSDAELRERERNNNGNNGGNGGNGRSNTGRGKLGSNNPNPTTRRHNSFSSGSNSNSHPLNMDVIFNPKKNKAMNEFRSMVKSNKNAANELKKTHEIARQGTYPRANPTFARQGYPTATFKHNANRQKFYGKSVNKIKKRKKRKTKKRLARINNNNNNNRNKSNKKNKKKNSTKKMNETKMGGGKRKSRRKVPLSILFGTKLSKSERLKRWKTLKKHKKNRTHKKRKKKRR